MTPIIERDPLEGFAFAIFGNLCVLGRLECDPQGYLVAIDPAFEYLRIQARDPKGNVVEFLSNVLPLFGFPHWTRLDLHHAAGTVQNGDLATGPYPLRVWRPDLVHSLSGLSEDEKRNLAQQVDACMRGSQAMRTAQAGIQLVTEIPKVDPRRMKLP